MILITGATGHLGKLTLDFLLKKSPAIPLAAMVRDSTKALDLRAKGIDVRVGDYTDHTSLVKAFEGVKTLLFVSSGTIQDRLAQHLHVISAAEKNGVKNIVYTSGVNAHPKMKFTPGIDHYYTEEALKQSGIAYTIFRNTFYTEVLPMFLGDALASGNWYFPAGNAKANFASRKDMAEALANVLVDPSAHKCKTYEITSAKSYSFAELAEVLSNIHGSGITYSDIPMEAYVEALKHAGVPDQFIPIMAGVADGIKHGELDLVDGSLEILLNRAPSDLKDYLPEVLSAAAIHHE